MKKARGIGIFLACCGFLQAEPSYDDLLARGRSALAAKDYQAGVAASEQAIRMDDRRWEAYAIAANAYTGHQLYDDAVESLQRALSRAPQGPTHSRCAATGAPSNAVRSSRRFHAACAGCWRKRLRQPTAPHRVRALEPHIGVGQ